MITAGQRLRALRERRDLSMREVASRSAHIAAKRRNKAFRISLTQLSVIETGGVVPSIHRVYALALIYEVELSRLLSWYKIGVCPKGRLRRT